MKLLNSYLDLGAPFFQQTRPVPVADPRLFLWNSDLAEDLKLSPTLYEDKDALAGYFSGNVLFDTSTPLALVYAGHQFGQFNPRLGDGRAHLLGEVLDKHNLRKDIQLKGSGRTAYSRSGDGRCALGPAIREFVMSEAMVALGVSSTRCLAVVTTGEKVYREVALPGAVVTRIADSHLRVGTFEYFYAQNDVEAVRALCDYAIDRHFPDVATHTDSARYSAFLEAVCERQIALVCDWMRVGFIHGVMNTDNTSVAGETIDFGPCAMMNAYHPNTVFSSIDRMGRYRFGHQPVIAQWNMARLAESVLPLLDDSPEAAVDKAEALVTSFGKRFKTAFMAMMGRKIGIITQPDDEPLIMALLDSMQKHALDYTQTFNAITLAVASSRSDSPLQATLGDWLLQWRRRLQREDGASVIGVRMRRENPVVIPRNHHVEAVIAECVASGKADAVLPFIKALRSPYKRITETERYQDAPADGDRNYQTFCGT